MEQELVCAFMESFQVSMLIASEKLHVVQCWIKAPLSCTGRDRSLLTPKMGFAGTLPLLLLLGPLHSLVSHTVSLSVLPFLFPHHFFVLFGSVLPCAVTWGLGQPMV